MQLKELYEQFASLMTDETGCVSLERLRKKVTHDIEHQIEDLIKQRDFVAKKVGLDCERIEIPEVKED